MAAILPFSPAAAPTPDREPSPRRPRIGELLVRAGALAPDALEAALAEQAGQNQRLGRILVVNGPVSDEDLGAALSRQSGIGRIDLAASPPDPTLLAGIDPYRCLALEAIPWRQVGGTRIVAIGGPEAAEAAMAACGGGAARVALALAAPEDDPPGADRCLRRPAARRCPGALSGGLQLPRMDRSGRPAGAHARAGGGGDRGDGRGPPPRPASAARLGARRQRPDHGAAAHRAPHPLPPRPGSARTRRSLAHRLQEAAHGLDPRAAAPRGEGGAAVCSRRSRRWSTRWRSSTSS